MQRGRAISCFVNEEAGDKLQHVKGFARADHRPLQMFIDVQLKLQGSHVVRWNFDLMSSALGSGHDSARMLREGFQEWSEENGQQWHLALAQGPSKGWRFIAQEAHKWPLKGLPIHPNLRRPLVFQ
eukprot:4603846-Heterocapsa_arctica.AAC.1